MAIRNHLQNAVILLFPESIAEFHSHRVVSQHIAAEIQTSFRTINHNLKIPKLKRNSKLKTPQLQQNRGRSYVLIRVEISC
jgi:hypothetical protein